MFQPSITSPAPAGSAVPAAAGIGATPRSRRQRHGMSTCRLLWHERLCTTTGSAVQLRVPLLGATASDLAARLSARLDSMWTGRASADGGTVTSVATAIGRAGGSQSLIIFISLDRLPTRRRVDDARMARELQQALDQCNAVGT